MHFFTLQLMKDAGGNTCAGDTAPRAGQNDSRRSTRHDVGAAGRRWRIRHGWRRVETARVRISRHDHLLSQQPVDFDLGRRQPESHTRTRDGIARFDGRSTIRTAIALMLIAAPRKSRPNSWISASALKGGGKSKRCRWWRGNMTARNRRAGCGMIKPATESRIRRRRSSVIRRRRGKPIRKRRSNTR